MKTETEKFDNAKQLLEDCKVIFTDIYKGNQEILDKFQKLFKKEKDNQAIEEELKKLKDYYEINEKESEDIAKNIFIFTKKNIYKTDIKCLQYFLKLFNAEETELSKKLNESKIDVEDEENLNFEKLKNINDFLESIEMYINKGRDDSQSMQLIRLLNNRENEIKFALEKDIDSAAALIYKINPTAGSLQFNDILQYQSCVDFVNDFKEKMKDNEILTKLREKLRKMSEVSENNKETKEENKKENTNVDKVIKMFEHYFIHFGSIKSLDQNFDGSEIIYENIKSILNNSKFKIELFKREFKVYEDDNTLAFLSIEPESFGHTLVIPKKHYTNLDDIDINVLTHINEIAKKYHVIFKEKLNIDGMQIVQNNGNIQEVKHYHMHLIPNYINDKTLSVDEVFEILKK